MQELTGRPAMPSTAISHVSSTRALKLTVECQFRFSNSYSEPVRLSISHLKFWVFRPFSTLGSHRMPHHCLFLFSVSGWKFVVFVGCATGMKFVLPSFDLVVLMMS